MKTRKMKITILASMLVLIAYIAPNLSFAHTKDMSKMKDCCMMKDGKMMQMKSGKMTPMKKDVTTKNGTICMTNGECTMKDGTKMKMQNGDCIDMDGTMDKCEMMKMDSKSSNIKKGDMDVAYTCSMHPEVTSDKPGKCPKCGMDLIEKN